MHRDRGGVSPGSAGIVTHGGPLVRAQLTLSRTLWRIGPAWSVLAGALALGWEPVDTDAILRLVAAVVLGDAAWGSLRQMIPGAPVGFESPHISPAILPYTQPGAPLARLLSHLGGDAGQPAATAWQPLAVSLVLVIALSLLTGPAALALSAGVLLLVTLAWLLVVNRGSHPALCYALMDVTAPWLLGMSTAGLGAFTSHGAIRAFALLAGFTVLQWGAQRAARKGAAELPVGVWAGQATVLAALIAAQQAWACAIVAALFSPPSWWLLRRGEDWLARALPWWWGAFGVAALALGQTIHTL